jgi:formylglycine-generating enzyme required for sulfatase activity
VNELLAKLQQVTPTGWKVRLPTEAEWEYACRAGTSTAYFCGDTITEAQANYDGTAKKEGGTESIRVFQTTPVGKYPPNAWGLYDMAGNTLEWCQDWYDPNYYKTSPGDDPCNTTPAAWGVQRGGCWIHGPKLCRSAARSPSPQTYFAGSISFRVVLSPN